jgi:hypothetical protein
MTRPGYRSRWCRNQAWHAHDFYATEVHFIVTTLLLESDGEGSGKCWDPESNRTRLDYVRMRLQLYPNASALVAVSELAFRFRESQWVIRRALRVLESRRQAEKISLDDIWKLQI